tara:strand:+ start:74 stop:376 length:303 start_codon:yes stop_codon:yes gene_type:complete
MDLDLIIQVTCNCCGAVTASQHVESTNPGARGASSSTALPFTLAPCCSSQPNPCVSLVVMTRKEWVAAGPPGEPAVFNGTMVQAAKDLLDYVNNPPRRTT